MLQIARPPPAPPRQLQNTLPPRGGLLPGGIWLEASAPRGAHPSPRRAKNLRATARQKHRCARGGAPDARHCASGLRPWPQHLTRRCVGVWRPRCPTATGGPGPLPVERRPQRTAAAPPADQTLRPICPALPKAAGATARHKRPPPPLREGTKRGGYPSQTWVWGG